MTKPRRRRPARSAGKARNLTRRPFRSCRDPAAGVEVSGQPLRCNVDFRGVFRTEPADVGD
jgi:hypothetical protein